MFGAVLAAGRRLPPPDAGRRRLGRPARPRPEAVAEDVLDEQDLAWRGPRALRRRRRRARRRRLAATAELRSSRPPRRACDVKITRIEATPLAIPLAQEFHWAGGTQVGANLVLFTVHTDEGVIGYGESICEDPRAVVAYGELMARQFVGRLAGRRRGDPALGLDARAAGRCSPQFTHLVVAGHRGRLLGRARPGARRPDAHVLRRARSATSSTTSASSRATSRSSSRAHAARARGRGHRACIYLKVGRGARDDDACVAAVREAIGPGPAAAHRPERGVGSRDRGRADPPARAVRPRLGRAARRPRAT